MRIINVIISTLFNRCPRCHQGQVFKEANPYVFARMFEMHSHCSHCGLKYQKEASFFYGAMYVSYALTSGWFIVWYLLYVTVLNSVETFTFAIMIASSILLLSPLTLRFSRLIWLNFFYKYRREYTNINSHNKNNHDTNT